jgi:hypothetical protein
MSHQHSLSYINASAKTHPASSTLLSLLHVLVRNWLKLPWCTMPDACVQTYAQFPVTVPLCRGPPAVPTRRIQSRSRSPRRVRPPLPSPVPVLLPRQATSTEPKGAYLTHIVDSGSLAPSGAG